MESKLIRMYTGTIRVNNEATILLYGIWIVSVGATALISLVPNNFIHNGIITLNKLKIKSWNNLKSKNLKQR